MNNFLRATPRKLVVHVLMHEIRHWAQIGTIFRLNGLTGEIHDFLFSPSWAGNSSARQADQRLRDIALFTPDSRVTGYCPFD
jgi:DinB family protein